MILKKSNTQLIHLFSTIVIIIMLFISITNTAFAQIIYCTPKINESEKLSIPEDVIYYPPEIQRIIKKGVIRIAMKKNNSAPFFFKSNNEYFGLDFEIGCAIAKELNVKAEFIRTETTFNGVIDSVVRNNADIAISKLSATIEREQKVLFTIPYAKFTHGFLINRERVAAIDSKGDKYKNIMKFIKDGKLEIGVIENSSYEFFANKYLKPDKNQNLKIISYDSWDDLVEDVVEGKTAIAYRDIMEVKNILKNNPELAINLRPAIIEGTEDNISIAVNSQYSHLRYWLDGLLKRYIEQDERIKKQESKEKQKCIKNIQNNFKENSIEEAINQFCNNISFKNYDSNSILNSEFQDKSLFSEYILK